MRKFIKLISFIFLLCVTLAFSDTEIPHEVITENPAKEVTTVESKKLKEKAEFDILVNKITPIELTGHVNSEGKTTYEILKIDEEKSLLNRVKNKMMPNPNGQVEYFITENLSQILNDNQKQARGRGKRSLPQGIDYEVTNGKNSTVLTVNTDKPVYIAKLRDGVMENVFSGIVFKNDLGARMVTTHPENVVIFKIGEQKDDSKTARLIKGNEWTTGEGGHTWWLRSFGIYLEKDKGPMITDKYIIDKYGENKYAFSAIPYIKKVRLNKVFPEMVRLDRFKGGPASNGNPGPDWRNNGGYYTTSNQTSWIYDMISGDIHSTTTYTSFAGEIWDLTAQIRYGIPQHVGVYEYIYTLWTNQHTNQGNRWSLFPQKLIVQRDNKNYEITPKMINNENVESPYKIFDESTSIVSGPENKLPIDWNYRYDDTTEPADKAYGLHLRVENSGELQVQQIGKRRVRIKKASTGLDLEVWLDRVEESAKLKYQFHSLGGGNEQVKIKVIHEAYGYNLYQDTLTIKVPIRKVYNMTYTIDKRLLKLDGYLNANGKYYYSSGDFGGSNTKNYSELMFVNVPNIGSDNVSATVANYGGATDKKGYNFYYNSGNGISLKIGNTTKLLTDETFVWKHLGTTWRTAEILTSAKDLILVDILEYDSVGTEGYKGAGTFILNLLKVNESVTFPMGKNVSGTADDKSKYPNIYTRDLSGVFPNTSGVRGTKNIVDNLIVYDGNETKPVNGRKYDAQEFSIEFLDNGDMKITKTKDWHTDRTISIDYRYGNVKLGNFVLKVKNRETINIGSANFEVDNRLSGVGNWFFANGKVAGNISRVGTDYSKLMKISNNFTSLEKTNIEDVHSIKNRPEKMGSHTDSQGKKYWWFTPSRSDYSNESAAPYDFNLSDIGNHIIMSRNNTSGIGSENEFILFAENNSTYRGNITETYTQTANIEAATATLDLSSVGLNVVGSWASGAKGNASSTNGNGLVLKFIEGQLFDTKGLDRTSVIVNKLVIKENGSEVGKAEGSLESRLVTNTTYNTFIMEADGQLSIGKIKPHYEERTYTIEPYYNEIKLGSLEVTILNDVPKDVGTITFDLDNRLISEDSNTGSWVFGSKGIVGALREEKVDYSKVVDIRGKFAFPNEATSRTISDVLSIEGRDYKTSGSDSEGTDYAVFLKGSNNYTGESAFPRGIAISALDNKIVVSKNNGTNADKDNKFRIVDDQEYQYIGNIVENYIGTDAENATATLSLANPDMSSPNDWKQIWATWAYGSSGNSASINSSNGKTYTMKFTSGKLFDTKGLDKTNSIATKIVVTSDKESKTFTGEGTAGQSISIATTHNEFTILSNGDFQVKKIAPFYEEETFTIKTYYNEMILGTLTLKITNDTPIDLGEVTFELDTRTRVNSYGNWFTIKGEHRGWLSDPNPKEAKEVVDIQGSLKNTNGNNISDIVSMEGRVWRNHEGSNPRYKKYAKTTSSWDEEAAIPIEIPLNQLEKNLAVSILNDTTSPMLDNKFVLTDGTYQYKGNVKEVYRGEAAIKAEGKINFKRTGHIATWAPGSTGDSNLEKVKIVFTPAGENQDSEVFDIRGVLKSRLSIADKLKVTQTGGETKEVTGNVGSDLVVNFDSGEMFKIDKDGNLTIKGDYRKAVKTFTIEPYYGAIPLGKLVVTLETGEAFIIEGEDTYDFGKMLPGGKYNLTGNFYIKNLGDLNVVDVSVPQTAEMTHKENPEQKVPMKLQSHTRVVGKDVQAIIDVTALPNPDQQVGNYEGQFFVTITINE